MEALSFLTRTRSAFGDDTELYLPVYGFLSARAWNLGGKGFYGAAQGYLAEASGEDLGRPLTRGDLSVGWVGWREPKGLAAGGGLRRACGSRCLRGRAG